MDMGVMDRDGVSSGEDRVSRRWKRQQEHEDRTNAGNRSACNQPPEGGGYSKLHRSLCQQL